MVILRYTYSCGHSENREVTEKLSTMIGTRPQTRPYPCHTCDPRFKDIMGDLN